METIVFDESGNTGADLLNDQQKVFILASSNLTQEDADELLKIVHTPQAKEVKFVTLKKSDLGKKRIIEFIKQSIPFRERIKTTLYYKRYMVISKIVDIIIEPMALSDGIDLYKDGANLALSNLLFYCMDSLCGKKCSDEMYKSFVRMIRSKDQVSINTFYCFVRQALDVNIVTEFQSILATILDSESVINNLLDGIDANSLDPAIPSFFEHSANWGDTIGKNFNVLHDNSKPIFQNKETLELFMSKKIPYKKIGYDRRQFGFPLRSNGICFGESKNDTRLQIVDLIAGSSAFWANGIVNGNIRNKFWHEIDQLDVKQFAINALWPSSEVTPKGLGTNGGGGINAVDYMAKQLWDLNYKTYTQTK